MKDIDNWLLCTLSQLENVFNSGNYGALKDAVYWCGKYEKPLPEWVTLALFDVLNGLSTGDKDTFKNWSKWGRDYKQDMADYEIWDLVGECRDNGAQWKDDDIYYIAAAIRSNKTEEEGGDKANTLKKTRNKRVLKKMKQNPHSYYQLKTFKINSNYYPHRSDLWVWIKNMIKAGNPKIKKKQ